MFEIFQYDFMINALIASILASVAFGIVGSYVVVKRIVFISGGISHTAYGGIGLGFLLGFNPIYGALLFSIIAALFISYMRKQTKQYEDTLIGIMWAFGMALGVIFINLSPGYAPNLMSYLFGNILTIPTSDIYLMLFLDITIVLMVFFFFNQFQAITFDEEFAYTIGLPVDLLYTVLLLMTALTTVLLIKLVGIILVIALLSIPAAIGIKYVSSLKHLMIVSVLLGIVFNVVGLLFSYYLNLASGATIIMISIIGYFISALYSKMRA
ncbi:MAG: metal ABC transporter permease [Melioribacteraceae bacterium]|nr:metal ABC transporter permease [Melioribacteraceae bacterium]MCF8353794.1 metal ABC transporter permease [Melioribacteraceae bacterium]MCF8393630.1 metal ABC transporter permease [Melioribacteraceae bacterium]MCF8419440.1 metal ABC transporter permease [Melioribacteraceae bacterium]